MCIRDRNKGYAAPGHLDALRRLGPCELHRRSWRLPGVMNDDGVVAADAAVPTDAPDVNDVDAMNAVDDLTRVGER